MDTRFGRVLAIALAVGVAPAFALAQATVGSNPATGGSVGSTATGGTPSFEPGGIGPGGTAWSGSMPRQNVNVGRGGGPRSNNGLGINAQPGANMNDRLPNDGTPNPTLPPSQSVPGTSGNGVIGGPIP